jgi:hypothetical protein
MSFELKGEVIVKYDVVAVKVTLIEVTKLVSSVTVRV